jgi:hypothetical protein
MDDLSSPRVGNTIRILDEPPAAGRQYRCAEMVCLRWTAASGEVHNECAILVEISTEGGLFLVDVPAERDTPVRIALPDGALTGAVQSCSREGSSWALQVSVNAPSEWFGGRYRPEVLVPEADEDVPFHPLDGPLFGALPVRDAARA